MFSQSGNWFRGLSGPVGTCLENSKKKKQKKKEKDATNKEVCAGTTD